MARTRSSALALLALLAAAAIVAVLDALNDDCEPVDGGVPMSKRLTSWEPAQKSGR